MDAAGEEVATAPASITLTENAGIRGLNIFFPKQWSYLTEEGFKPVPHSYAVRGRGEGVYLIDCAIAPAWQMVDFASYPCDNFMIKRVAGWGMKKGINIGGGTRGGTIEFTQLSPGMAIETARNSLGWQASVRILPSYSGKNSVSYFFGDASNIECYGLQSFHPINHIVMYKQENAGKSLSLRDSRFYYPLLDVSTEQSLVMDGARNIDFYGYWVSGRDRNLSWVKATDIENIRVYAPGVLPTYHRGNYEELVPIDQFKLIPETPRLPSARIVQGDPSASHVLDGNLETYWKAPLDKAHFVVDLGEVMKVHRYTLVDGHMFNFKDTTAIKRYRISASLNSADWTPLEIPAANVANYQYNNPQKFVILDQPVVPTEARYVKLEILDSWQPAPNKAGKEARSAIIRLFNIWADTCQ